MSQLSFFLASLVWNLGLGMTWIVVPLYAASQGLSNAQIGTLFSMMLPFSVAFVVSWTIFLLIYWTLGIPLGLQAPYGYPG